MAGYPRGFYTRHLDPWRGVRYSCWAVNVARIADLCKVYPGSILDIGCSVGHHLYRLRSIYADARLVGVDHGEAPAGEWMLKDDGNAEFIDIDLESPSLPDIGRFDLVTSSFVFEHLKSGNEEVLAKWISSSVNPRGVLWLSYALEGMDKGGYKHVNCRSHEFWRGLFSSSGMIFDSRMTEVAQTVVKTWGFKQGHTISVFRAG